MSTSPHVRQLQAFIRDQQSLEIKLVYR
ncbi:Hfq-like protein [Halomicronema hongdechloris]